MSLLTVTQQEGVRWITLDRPSEANALSLELAIEFRDAIVAAEADAECIVVVFAGNGRFFSAGGDVAAMAAADNASAFLRELAGTMHDALLALARSRLITIAAVHGPAAGAGLALVLNADIAIATPKAAFIGAYAKVGLTPDCGTSFLLPRSIGPGRAASMLLTGRVLDAPTALDWGLVAEVVDDADLHARVSAVAADLVAGASHVLGATKRLLNETRLAGYEQHLAQEAESISSFVTHPETRVLVQKFTERSSSR